MVDGLSADEGGAGREREAEDQGQRNGRSVHQAPEGGELVERHGKVPELVNEPPGQRRVVRSGQCLDSTYLNGVKMIFTAFG